MEAKLSHAEIAQITGYQQHAKQLEELLRMGFWRARRSRLSGSVILERAHYEAVCRGEQQPSKESRRPKLQPV